MYTWAWVKCVCIMRRLKIFFRVGLILNDIKILDPWIYCLYNMIFLSKMTHTLDLGCYKHI